MQSQDEAVSLSWGDLAYEQHRGMQRYVKALNKLYNEYPAMYVHDGNAMGFEWMSCDDRKSSVVSFVRRGETAKKQLLFVCNFHTNEYRDYRVGVPCAGYYKEVLNSDAEEFGGQCINCKKSFIHPIHLQIMQSIVRGQHPGSQISRN